MKDSATGNRWHRTRCVHHGRTRHRQNFAFRRISAPRTQHVGFADFSRTLCRTVRHRRSLLFRFSMRWADCWKDRLASDSPRSCEPMRRPGVGVADRLRFHRRARNVTTGNDWRDQGTNDARNGRRARHARNYSPVVLLLEDLHWADPSSVDLLRHLCQRISNQRLLIAGTFRPEDIERSNHPLKSYKAEMQAHKLCEEMALDSLSREHIAGLSRRDVFAQRLSAEFAALIHEKTEGHPLFAMNLLQYLGERGDIAKTNEHWSLVRPLSEMELEVPESVRSMISKKIDALGEEERRTLAVRERRRHGISFYGHCATARRGRDRSGGATRAHRENSSADRNARRRRITRRLACDALSFRACALPEFSLRRSGNKRSVCCTSRPANTCCNTTANARRRSPPNSRCTSNADAISTRRRVSDSCRRSRREALRLRRS